LVEPNEEPVRRQARKLDEKQRCSEIVEQGHETKIHVQLLMAMKEGESGVVRHKVDFHFLVAAYHHNILVHTG
jgi:hypothetical protein